MKREKDEHEKVGSGSGRGSYHDSLGVCCGWDEETGPRLPTANTNEYIVHQVLFDQGGVHSVPAMLNIAYADKTDNIIWYLIKCIE